MKMVPVSRWFAVLLSMSLVTIAPALAAGSHDSHHAAKTHHLALRLADDPSKPLFTVGISGGFTGVQMVASAYRDGRVLTVRLGLGRSSAPVETRVPLSLGAVQAVLGAAMRSHVFAIPPAFKTPSLVRMFRFSLSALRLLAVYEVCMSWEEKGTTRQAARPSFRSGVCSMQ
jgi:hypothetical protein